MSLCNVSVWCLCLMSLFNVSNVPNVTVLFNVPGQNGNLLCLISWWNKDNILCLISQGHIYDLLFLISRGHKDDLLCLLSPGHQDDLLYLLCQGHLRPVLRPECGASLPCPPLSPQQVLYPAPQLLPFTECFLLIFSTLPIPFFFILLQESLLPFPTVFPSSPPFYLVEDHL